eukprot:7506652-Alexandrium_andersonii.AAC.1
MRLTRHCPEAPRCGSRDPSTGRSRSGATEVPGRTRREAKELGLHRVGHGTTLVSPNADRGFGNRGKIPGSTRGLNPRAHKCSGVANQARALP